MPERLRDQIPDWFPEKDTNLLEPNKLPPVPKMFKEGVLPIIDGDSGAREISHRIDIHGFIQTSGAISTHG